MKLRRLEVSGFRAFATRQVFDLDADTVIVVGPNGQGKTSFFDAIFWAVAGSIPRLGEEGSVVSVFSDAGEARVALELCGDQTTVRIVRSSDGTDSLLSLEADGETLRGPEATSRLFRLLWAQALSAAKPAEALVSALERGVYLQQDRVRDFIEAESDQQRFTTVSELIGAGRINELQMSLERSRKAWSQVTNARARETQVLQARIDDLELQLTRLGSDTEAAFEIARWQEWWQGTVQFGIVEAGAPSPDAPDAAARIDSAVKELLTRREAEARRRQEALYLQAALADLPQEPANDIEELRRQASAAQMAFTQAQAALAQAESRAAEVRRLQVEAAEAREQLRALAQLALRHLADRCPVCGQEYDRDDTRDRLEALAAETIGGVGKAPEIPDIAAAAALVQQHDRAARAAAHAVADAEARAREWSTRRAELDTRAERLGLSAEPLNTWPSRIASAIGEIDERIDALERQARAGERVALELARAGQRARRAEIEHELDALRTTLTTDQAEVDARERTTALVAQLIEALRGASADVVETELTRIEPLLQRIYATADPHPAFRVVRLLSRMRQGRGRIVSRLEDPVRELPSEAPGAVLSSSQMNVLAVSIFLALNLGMASLPLETAILDDPLQSLDDLNLLGLTDLLRRTRERRQLLVSTHDPRFAGLLERKLRPVRDGQRTLVFSLEAWGPDGLEVSMREIDRDRDPVRIAA